MPTYNYVAIDDYGRKAEGVFETTSEVALRETLEDKGYYLIEAQISNESPLPEGVSFYRPIVEFMGSITERIVPSFIANRLSGWRG
jgi:type II secretory pathway component PulF